MAETYDYSVSFTGVGDPPKDSTVGHCSQVAIFVRNQPETDARLKTSPEVECSYSLVRVLLLNLHFETNHRVLMQTNSEKKI